MSKTISRSVMPIGTSIRPVLLTRPGQGEHLGALALLGADRGEPLAAVADDRRNVGEGLDVVDQRRAAPQARLGRERRTRARAAALAFDRGDQSAVSSPHTNAPAPRRISTCEVEGRAADAVAQQRRCVSACLMAVFSRLTASGYSART